MGEPGVNPLLDRIIDVTERFRYFTLPKDFHLDQYLSPSWGIYDGQEVTVKVRFGPTVCDYIMRKVWHPSEQKESLPDGGCVCTYTVAGTEEIKKWIYSWLPYAEVLEPQWFREQVEKELSVALEQYT